jgi:hypothetical protein
MALSTESTDTRSATDHVATWRNLALTYVAGVLVLTLQSVAYHLHTHENRLASDIPFYVISGLVGVAIAAIALLRVHRSTKPATTARVGIVLSAFGIAIFAVAYYMPITFILGGTSYLLSRDAEPGRSASAARVLGIIAMLCSVAVAVARICGVTYQLGG